MVDVVQFLLRNKIREEPVIVAALERISELCDASQANLEAFEASKQPAFWNTLQTTALARLSVDEKIVEAAAKITSLCELNAETLTPIAANGSLDSSVLFWLTIKANISAQMVSSNRQASAPLVLAVCRAIRSLCGDGSDNTINSIDAKNLDSLSKIGACEAVVIALKSYPMNAGVSEQACAAISTLALGVQAPSYKKYPGVLAVGDVVRRGRDWTHGHQDVDHTAHDGVRRAGVVRQVSGGNISVEWRKDVADPTTAFLTQTYKYDSNRHDVYLVDIDSARNRLVRAGACRAVVAALKQHPGSASVAERGCLAVYNLTSETAMDDLIAASVCEALVAALCAHTGSAKVAEQAMKAVRCLATTDSNRETLLAAGACQAVTKALQAHGANVTIAQWGVGTITRLALGEGCGRALGAAGCAAVISALQQHTSNEDLCIWACQAILSLAASNDEKFFAGAREAIEKSISIHCQGKPAAAPCADESAAVDALISSADSSRGIASGGSGSDSPYTPHPVGFESDFSEDVLREGDGWPMGRGGEFGQTHPGFNTFSAAGRTFGAVSGGFGGPLVGNGAPPAPWHPPAPFGFGGGFGSFSVMSAGPAEEEPQAEAEAEAEDDSQRCIATALSEAAIEALEKCFQKSQPHGHVMIKMCYGNSCSGCRMSGPSPQSGNLFCKQCKLCGCCVAQNKACTHPVGKAVNPSTHNIVKRGMSNSVSNCAQCRQMIGRTECSDRYCSACATCAMCCSRAAFCSASGAAPAMPFEETHARHATLLALLVMGHLAEHMATPRGFESVVNAVKMHVSHAGVAEQGMLAIGKLLRPGDDRSNPNPNPNLPGDDRSELGPAARVVAEGLGLHAANAGVVVAACRTLRLLAGHSASEGSNPLVAKLGAAGACGFVVRAMQEHPENAEVAEEAFEVIDLLVTHNFDNLMKFDELHHPRAVAATLIAHAANLKVKTSGLKAIRRLAFSDDIRTKLLESGIPESWLSFEGPHHDVVELKRTPFFLVRSFSNSQGEVEKCYCGDPRRLIGSETKGQRRVEDLRLGCGYVFIYLSIYFSMASQFPWIPKMYNFLFLLSNNFFKINSPS